MRLRASGLLVCLRRIRCARRAGGAGRSAGRWVGELDRGTVMSLCVAEDQATRLCDLLDRDGPMQTRRS
jgi:hypothetical protein